MSRARTGLCISWANSSGVFEAQKEPVEERVTTAHVVEGSGHAGQIFVNYRRDGAAGDAHGVHDGLAAKFGEPNVFMDVDNLRPGQRFDVELAKASS